MARIIDYDEMNLVGDKIKKLRLERNMSQKEFSEKLEIYAIYICRGSVSRIEKKIRTITDFELIAIARVLRVPISELFADLDETDI